HRPVGADDVYSAGVVAAGADVAGQEAPVHAPVVRPAVGGGGVVVIPGPHHRSAEVREPGVRRGGGRAGRGFARGRGRGVGRGGEPVDDRLGGDQSASRSALDLGERGGVAGPVEDVGDLPPLRVAGGRGTGRAVEHAAGRAVEIVREGV